MKRIALPLLLITAALAAGLWWYVRMPEADGDSWQGWVEADSRFIGPEVAGRLIDTMPKQGTRVEAGDRLFSVESEVARAKVESARSALAQAEARLAAARAPRQRPQEIDVLTARESAARAALEASRLDYERARTLARKGTAATSVLDKARAAFDRDTALLEEIRRQIAVARLPARQPDLDAALEARAEAQARLRTARLEAAKHTVTAPMAGTIQEVYYRPGEVVGAGSPVIALLPPEAIRLRFFVPEAELAHLALGDAVTVTCDGCTPVTATIDFLADKAEFTPPVIYSLEERAKLVFRVEAVPRTPKALRVGLPVTIRPEARK